jgi:putative DNA primase/helicase
VKQLTGGDTYTARNLHENSIEFAPEFKIFINTNHLPNASDPTIFTSGRVKLIPFNRHFKPEEQDTGLKKFFRRRDNMSAIFNWLVEGYRLLREERLIMPERVITAVEEYKQESDYMSVFFFFFFVHLQNNRLKISVLLKLYQPWAKENGYKIPTAQEFVGDLRKRFGVKPDCKKGNVIVGYDLKK